MKATSESIGQVVVMTFDGEVLLEAPITAPFGESLEITLPQPPSRIAELTTVLRFGALPTSVSAANDADGI
jgi:preprotein translocase subunit SecD